MNSRGIITYAAGKSSNIKRAKALARSLMLHDPTLMRAIITDSTERELGDLFTYQIHLRPGYGPERRQKLFLDRYTPFDETLFLDSASLAVHKLDSFWSSFKDVPFGVCGTRVHEPDEVKEGLDLPFLLDKFNLTSLPDFSGAAYYFKRSAGSKAVFETARNLGERAAELRFIPSGSIGAVPSDEAIFSLAMALHGLSGTDMRGGGLFTAIDSTTNLHIDVQRGTCTLAKRGLVHKPVVLHAANFVDSLPYLRECARLEHRAQGLPGLTRGERFQLLTTSTALQARRKAISLLNRAIAGRPRTNLSTL
jgi:hypothetical protein